MINIYCPHCNASHYFINYGVNTALYSPMEYRDGELVISNDPNYHTYSCTCAECNTTFSYTIYHGGLVSLNENGLFNPITDVTEIVLPNEEADKMRANMINSIATTELNLDGRTITIEGKDINKGSITD